jgi:hypothetical protein
MHDPYPQYFEIEIDRDGLRNLLRLQSFVGCLILLGIIGAFFGLLFSAKEVQVHPRPWEEAFALTERNIAISLTASVLVTLFLERLVFKRFADRYAQTFRVSVEGPFLRIQETSIMRTDRRLHFRAIVDYTLQQTWMASWFSVESIVMTTTGSGPKSTVCIVGVLNGLKTRDLLSEVDRLREDAP